jgi:hypothetical protein
VTEDDARDPLEQAMEMFVYAPIGLLFDGASLLPELVAKGKNQVSMARMVGRFAVAQGHDKATKAAETLQHQASALIGVVTPGDDGTPRPAASTPPQPAAAKPATRPARRSRSAQPPPDLAIPDYDGLSASQVVNRLPGLSPAELEQVRRHEAANRGRKTILSKVAQLQSG